MIAYPPWQKTSVRTRVKCGLEAKPRDAGNRSRSGVGNLELGFSPCTKAGKIIYRALPACLSQEVPWFVLFAVGRQPLPDIYIIRLLGKSDAISLHASFGCQALGWYPDFPSTFPARNRRPRKSGARNSDGLPRGIVKAVVSGVRVRFFSEALQPRLHAFNAKVLCYLGSNRDCCATSVCKLDGSQTEVCGHCCRKICLRFRVLANILAASSNRAGCIY